MEHLKLNIGPSASKLNMKSFKTSKGQRTLSTRKPIPLIIDTDLAFGSDSADIDDALAILLALAHPEQFDVLAVTAVSGNVDGVRASANIDILLDRIGFGHIPHCASGTRPWDANFWVQSRWNAQKKSVQEREKASQTKFQIQGQGSDLIRDILRSAPQAVTIACVGPLTNLALVLSTEPELLSKIGLVACMGGVHLIPGVLNGPTEFNILADPEAASFVFNTGIPIALFPLDVTKKQALFPEDLELWRKTPGAFMSDLADAAHAYMYHRSKMYNEKKPFMYFHDALPIIWLLQEKYFEMRPCQISVDCSGEFTRGVTIIDTHVRNRKQLDHQMAWDVDATEVLDLVMRDLADCYGRIK